MKIFEHQVKNFWDKVAVGSNDECWEWQGSKNDWGYGHMRVGPRKENVRENAQRISYFLHHGEVDGVVCHRCDNPGCVNPAHLWLGTTGDNVQDRVRKDRSAKGTVNGRSKLTEEEVADIYHRTHSGGVIREMAREFGVDPQVIRKIRDGKTWKHVTENLAR